MGISFRNRGMLNRPMIFYPLLMKNIVIMMNVVDFYWLRIQLWRNKFRGHFFVHDG
uniref:Uncharacterized protein n=1 Tax=Physcomitrium patens TaxID=3218 RepID=A0A2K1JU73_PHYPA|nr:hypothetical protein PHYPA_014854 [Physcomitrium patens]